MQESQYNQHCSAIPAKEPVSMPAPAPECCGAGCVVCVLDYPDQFLDPQSNDSEMMAMLRAFEEAEAALINPDVRQDSET